MIKSNDVFVIYCLNKKRYLLDSAIDVEEATDSDNLVIFGLFLLIYVIRRVLNKPPTRNSLGQHLVVVSCVIFRGFHSFFCPICFVRELFFKHAVDKNHACHSIQ